MNCCGELCDEGTILVDDTNPLELSRFVQEKHVDLFIGGVKERPIAYKLGIGFCDHNHERKEALAGFEGMVNFAREVHRSVMWPVWKLVPRQSAAHRQPLSPGGRRAGSEGHRGPPAESLSDAPTHQRGNPPCNDVPASEACRSLAIETSCPRPPSRRPQRLQVCAPLGACLAFRGIEGAVPLLHGSQGCSTYIRRYMISHFKEPMDIASLEFRRGDGHVRRRGESAAGLENVVRQYRRSSSASPRPAWRKRSATTSPFTSANPPDGTERPARMVHVSTPSYAGTHAEGFHAAVRAIVETLAEARAAARRRQPPARDRLAGRPPLPQERPARLRRRPILLPDYSDTLDGPAWTEYQRIPPGGTPMDDIRRMGRARATIEFGSTWRRRTRRPARCCRSGSACPATRCRCRSASSQTDVLRDPGSAHRPPDARRAHQDERGRLIEAYVDAHKYISASGPWSTASRTWWSAWRPSWPRSASRPVLCGSGAKTGRLRARISELEPDLATREITVLEGVDFAEMEERAADCGPTGRRQQQGLRLARKLGVPLVRVGFPDPRPHRRAADAARGLPRRRSSCSTGSPTP